MLGHRELHDQSYMRKQEGWWPELEAEEPSERARAQSEGRTLCWENGPVSMFSVSFNRSGYRCQMRSFRLDLEKEVWVG